MNLAAAQSTRTGNVDMAEFTARFATEEEAKAFAAQFPKGVQMRGTSLIGHANGVTVVSGYAFTRFNFASTGVTGSKNETSIKRYRQMVKACGKLGIEITYMTPWSNSYPSREAFEAAL